MRSKRPCCSRSPDNGGKRACRQSLKFRVRVAQAANIASFTTSGFCHTSGGYGSRSARSACCQRKQLLSNVFMEVYLPPAAAAARAVDTADALHGPPTYQVKQTQSFMLM